MLKILSSVLCKEGSLFWQESPWSHCHTQPLQRATNTITIIIAIVTFSDHVSFSQYTAKCIREPPPPCTLISNCDTVGLNLSDKLHIIGSPECSIHSSRVTPNWNRLAKTDHTQNLALENLSVIIAIKGIKIVNVFESQISVSHEPVVLCKWVGGGEPSFSPSSKCWNTPCNIHNRCLPESLTEPFQIW